MKNILNVFIIVALLFGSILLYNNYYRLTLDPVEYLKYYYNNNNKFKHDYKFEDCFISIQYQPMELKLAKSIIENDNNLPADGNMVYIVLEYESRTGISDSLSSEKLNRLERSLYAVHRNKSYYPVIFFPENLGYQSGRQRIYCGFEIDNDIKPSGEFYFFTGLECIPDTHPLKFNIKSSLLPKLKINNE